MGYTPRTPARCSFCHPPNVPMPLIDAGKASNPRTQAPPNYPAITNRKAFNHTAHKKRPAGLCQAGQLGIFGYVFIRR